MLSEVNLGDMGFALIFEFFVRAVVGYENLICLLEGRVEAILAPNDSLVYADVELMTIFVGRLHVKNLLPDVLGVMVPRE